MVEIVKFGVILLEGDGKCILLIVGLFKCKSFCYLFVECYVQGVCSKDYVVCELKLGELVFDLIFYEGYEQSQVFEFDLLEVQWQIYWVEYLVFVYLVWWGGLLVLLQGFFDCVL